MGMVYAVIASLVYINYSRDGAISRFKQLLTTVIPVIQSCTPHYQDPHPARPQQPAGQYHPKTHILRHIIIYRGGRLYSRRNSPRFNAPFSQFPLSIHHQHIQPRLCGPITNKVLPLRNPRPQREDFGTLKVQSLLQGGKLAGGKQHPWVLWLEQELEKCHGHEMCSCHIATP